MGSCPEATPQSRKFQLDLRSCQEALPQPTSLAAFQKGQELLGEGAQVRLGGSLLFP